MKKLLIVSATMLIILLSLSCPLSALTRQDVEELTTSQLEQTGAEELEEKLEPETRSLLEQMGAGEITAGGLDLDPASFFQVMLKSFAEHWKAPYLTALSIAAVLILVSFLSNLQSGAHKGTQPLLDTVGALVISTLLLASLVPAIRRLTESISNCSVFMISFIPVFSSAAAASGIPVTAATHSVFSLACAEFISAFASQTLMPCIGIYLGLSVISGITLPDFSLDHIAVFLKKAVNTTLVATVTLYSGFLGVKSLITASTDTVTFKSAKFLMSSLVPVVGGAFGDAIGTVQGSLSMIKNTVGVFGLLAIFAYFLPNLIILLLWRISIAASNSTALILGQKRLSSLLVSAGDAVSILLAITVAVMAMFIITTAILLLMGGVSQ